MKLDTWWNNSWLQIPQAGYIVNCNWLTFAFVLAILTISLSSFALAFLGIHHLNGNHPCDPADNPHPARGCETGGELDHSEPLGKEAKNLDAWTKMGMKLLHNDGWVVGSWLVNWCKCFFCINMHRLVVLSLVLVLVLVVLVLVKRSRTFFQQFPLWRYWKSLDRLFRQIACRRHQEGVDEEAPRW